jgi:hypothetical protein
VTKDYFTMSREQLIDEVINLRSAVQEERDRRERLVRLLRPLPPGGPEAPFPGFSCACDDGY